MKLTWVSADCDLYTTDLNWLFGIERLVNYDMDLSNTDEFEFRSQGLFVSIQVFKLKYYKLYVWQRLQAIQMRKDKVFNATAHMMSIKNSVDNVCAINPY